MNRYRVTMAHSILGELVRIVDAATPAEAIEAVAVSALRDLRSELWTRALLEGRTLVFQVEPSRAA